MNKGFLKKSINRYFSINKIIRLLITTDLIFFTGTGLTSPFIAIFIVDKIQDGNVEVVGIGTTIYFICSSILQIPIARKLDKTKGCKDEVIATILGYCLNTIALFGWIFASRPTHVYILEAIMGIGSAIGYPAWTSLFTKYADKGKESTEWALYSTSINIFSSIAALIGGFIIDKWGFIPMFVVSAMLGGITTFIALLLNKNSLKKR